MDPDQGSGPQAKNTISDSMSVISESSIVKILSSRISKAIIWFCSLVAVSFVSRSIDWPFDRAASRQDSSAAVEASCESELSTCTSWKDDFAVPKIAELNTSVLARDTRIAHLEANSPIGSLYQGDFVTIERFNFDVVPFIIRDLGPCFGDDCYYVRFSKTTARPVDETGVRTFLRVDVQFAERSTGAQRVLPYLLKVDPGCYLEIQTPDSVVRIVVERIDADLPRYGMSWSPRRDGPQKVDKGPHSGWLDHRSGPNTKPECRGGKAEEVAIR